jgi:glycogen phosphorylase
MKFALNGALTLGTWDGATIEMAEAIGREHVFIFGHETDALARLQAIGYEPRQLFDDDPSLRGVLGAIADGSFSPGEPTRYRGLIDGLLQRDRYFLLADFADYLAAQARVDALYRDPAAWQRNVVFNIAGMGGFSTDRTIAEYADQVWSARHARAAQVEEQRRRHAG